MARAISRFRYWRLRDYEESMIDLNTPHADFQLIPMSAKASIHRWVSEGNRANLLAGRTEPTTAQRVGHGQS